MNPLEGGRAFLTTARSSRSMIASSRSRAASAAASRRLAAFFKQLVAANLAAALHHGVGVGLVRPAFTALADEGLGQTRLTQSVVRVVELDADLHFATVTCMASFSSSVESSSVMMVSIVAITGFLRVEVSSAATIGCVGRWFQSIYPLQFRFNTSMERITNFGKA